MSQPHSALQHFPIMMFAIVMGLMGFSLSLQNAAEVWPALSLAADLALMIALLVFIVFSLCYLVKLLRFPGAVVAEWQHPIRLAFFPAYSISLLLIATALVGTMPDVAHVIWLIAVSLQGVLTLAVISGWISHRAFEVGHLTPAWFIPAVGVVMAPFAGAPLGYEEIPWLFLSTGIVFWIVLLTLVMNRLMFHNPIQAALFPTLVILIAPPALGFVGYVTLTEEIDPLARILLNTSYVFALLVAIQLPKLRGLPFGLSWWALSFPVAALSVASFKYAALTGKASHVMIGAGLLAMLTVIIVYLAVQTTRAVLKGQVFRPE